MIINELVNWKNDSEHMPILLRGARQVGKTTSIEQFAASNFTHFVNINFELEPSYIDCFASLKPQEIINRISFKQNIPIVAGETLLFLDEIQNCPQAILALRYFKELMPQLHVIGAGSLLEFALNTEQFRMPVGRVQFLYMQPLSLYEYLLAREKHILLEYISKATLNNTDTIAHQELLKLTKEYIAVGGMPAVVDNYCRHGIINSCQNLQINLLATYRNDFGKYAKLSDHKYLQRTFLKIPDLIGKQVKYSKIDAECQSRDIKAAIMLLEHAGLLYKVNASGCSEVPLGVVSNDKKFKLLFVDIGLIVRSSKVDLNMLMDSDLTLVNQGLLAEQFVGQELLAYQDAHEKAELYFWQRDKGGQAEVDYVTSFGNQIIPIEVKSGKIGQLKSLKQFMLEKKPKIGIQISNSNLYFQNNVLSIPFYMIKELPRLINNY